MNTNFRALNVELSMSYRVMAQATKDYTMPNAERCVFNTNLVGFMTRDFSLLSSDYSNEVYIDG